MDKLTFAHPVGGTALTVGDFWAWAYSDILNNTTRSIFAEFLVGAALGLLDAPRIEWNAWDLTYGGRRIEVKASGYLQSWQPQKLSTIRYDIAAKVKDAAVTGDAAGVKARHSDCYVFCLYAEQDPQQRSITSTAAWHFYVVSTAVLNRRFPTQKSVALSVLKPVAGPPVQYDGLRAAVDAALQES
ncbi:MAG: hypothetical protein MUE40_05680 [Anaerolineae bacterium]|nr:hypothetical protein [Anaerolineae bacterium]